MKLNVSLLIIVFRLKKQDFMIDLNSALNNVLQNKNTKKLPEACIIGNKINTSCTRSQSGFVFKLIEYKCTIKLNTTAGM